ncbi:hypothetical protein [Anaeromicropila populeti]|uniref:hypothetical protein n=1 Tax=Anaeromicropila populeti TaxID=37658 RepID=UPI001A9A5D56|nr:hypothetical protein [Anaeromicropila populeti]
MLLIMGLTLSMFGSKINAKELVDVESEYQKLLLEKIQESDILDENNYSISFSSDSSDNQDTLKMNSIDEVISYLEQNENENVYNESVVITPNTQKKGLLALNDITYYTKNVKYVRSLTSTYTLSADVTMKSTNNYVTSISNPRLTLTGFTIGVGIEDISYSTSILDGSRTAYVSSDYTHVTTITTPIGVIEVHRELCHMYMYYKYDSVYDKGFYYL